MAVLAGTVRMPGEPYLDTATCRPWLCATPMLPLIHTVGIMFRCVM